jgi:hypothetical protein
MDTAALVKLGRTHLEKGELKEAKKQAKAISKLWESQKGSPTEAEWENASPFLGEILGTQAIWAAFKLRPKSTKKFLDETQKTTSAESEKKLENLFG